MPVSHELAHLVAFLPEDRVGIVESIEPIKSGLSGAGVYSVTSSRGAYILRVHVKDDGSFAQQLRVLRRAVDAGVAPAVVYVDEDARAVVSARVSGVPMPVALADPAQRGAVLASVIDRLRTLHELDPSGVAESAPLAYARATGEAARERPGFPLWASSLAPTLDAIGAALAADARRGLNHNDVNPGNILWDGARAWLIDWEVAGIGHPYYDLASLALFLRLDDHVALELVARHDGAAPDERSRTCFRALRQLAGLNSGLTILGLVEDLRVLPAQTPNDAPSLGDCYAGMRAGTLDMQSPRGRASMGLALLALGVGRT